MAPATDNGERQRRAKSAADRKGHIFFAALNHAYRNRRDAVPSADACRAVRRFRNFDRPRRLCLSIDEARQLLNAAPTDFRCIARGGAFDSRSASCSRCAVAHGQLHVQRHVWAKAVRAAIANHNRDASAKRRISAHATAYSFRHAHISELLQIYGVDPITVAAQTGTSVAMIEKAYLRFIPSAMQEKLAALKG